MFQNVISQLNQDPFTDEFENQSQDSGQSVNQIQQNSQIDDELQQNNDNQQQDGNNDQVDQNYQDQNEEIQQQMVNELTQQQQQSQQEESQHQENNNNQSQNDNLPQENEDISDDTNLLNLTNPTKKSLLILQNESSLILNEIELEMMKKKNKTKNTTLKALSETDQAQQCPSPCSKKNGLCVAGECLCKFPYVGATCDKKIDIKNRISNGLFVFAIFLSFIFGLLFVYMMQLVYFNTCGKKTTFEMQQDQKQLDQMEKPKEVWSWAKA